VDVTPRPTDVATRRRRKSPAMYGALVLIVVAIGFVLFQGLNSAALYYRNADEAVREKDSLGTRRFRVQGTVQNDVTKAGQDVTFTIQYPIDQPPNEKNTIHVHHVGDPPELFQSGLPVVLEGHWSKDGTVFESDRILVKHSEEYKEANPDHFSSATP
jgi:cytochrome c-type biogenesis protein CcmE